PSHSVITSVLLYKLTMSSDSSILLFFSINSSTSPRSLHSFPTRRSSDLTLAEQHLLEKNKISWKDELREAIEYARDNSTNFDSFKRHLNDVYGVETKLRGKTLSFKHPERERFIRANKLGADYE